MMKRQISCSASPSFSTIELWSPPPWKTQNPVEKHWEIPISMPEMNKFGSRNAVSSSSEFTLAEVDSFISSNFLQWVLISTWVYNITPCFSQSSILLVLNSAITLGFSIWVVAISHHQWYYIQISYFGFCYFEWNCWLPKFSSWNWNKWSLDFSLLLPYFLFYF